MSLWTPPHRTITLPGRPRRRVPARPDLRQVMHPQRLSGAPLDDFEVDHDDLVIHRQWRAFDPDAPGEVRYFMYEISQANPGEDHWRGFKAVRFLRLTRVPRWLRQQASGIGRPGFSQMAYILSALREQGVLFVQLVAKDPSSPLIFAYGVQAVGRTELDACERADQAYAALTANLDGVFQQIEYAPITLEEGERLSRHQATWREIAVARGRPIPNGESVGAAAVLDGNRTDIEQTHNQMEAFIRGMSEARRGFILSMVTVPLSPQDMTLAWRNVSLKLSSVRSETHGSKGFSAGVALPLGVGTSAGISHGDTHSTSLGHGIGTSNGESFSNGVSTSHGVSDAASLSHTAGVSHSATDGVSHSDTSGVSLSHSVGHSAGLSDSNGQTFGQSESLGHSVGQSLSDTHSHSVSAADSVSAGRSVTHGESLSHGQSTSDTYGVSSGLSHGVSSSESSGTSETRSLGQSYSEGSNWNHGENVSQGASVTGTEGWNQSAGINHSQALSLNSSVANQLTNSQSHADGWGVQGSWLGMASGGDTVTDTNGLSKGVTSTDAAGITHTGGNSFSTGISGSLAQGLNTSHGASVSQGGSYTSGMSATNSVGSNHTVGFGESLTSSQSQSHSVGTGENVSYGQNVGYGQNTGVGHSLTDGVTAGRTAGANIGSNTTTGLNAGANHTTGANIGTSDTVAQGVSQSQTAGVSKSVSDGTSASDTAGASHTDSVGSGTSQTAGMSAGSSANQAMADAYMVAMSRQASTTGSFGVVPSAGINVSKQTLDAAKLMIGDILEETQRRYMDGLEGGAWLYQMFLVTEDRETLMAASSLLKSAFWGPGTENRRLAQPFHVKCDFEPAPADSDDAGAAERERLRLHAQAFTSYRRREPVVELIEPFMYSSYITCGEMSAITRPPVAESLGLLAQHDSAPVLAMPADRQDREIMIGHIFNGERARISTTRFGVDVDELTHMLISGVTGIGKTTTLLRLLSELARVERTVVAPVVPGEPPSPPRQVPTSILAIDWMRNMRHLGSLLDPARTDPATGERTGRFQFFSVRSPELGRFRWNPLEVPADDMNPVEWLNAQADNMVASWNLGEWGRSFIAELVDSLYSANRLEPFELRPARFDADGNLMRDALVLDPVDPSTLPPEAVGLDPVTGDPVANVYTYPPLARLVGLSHLAILVAARVEELSSIEGARLHGTEARDKVQAVWRRVSYFAPGGQFADMIAYDESLDERTCLSISDLVDPVRGLVTVVETDGLDLANRRFVLGSVMLSLYRLGLHQGEGCFNLGGAAPGLFVVLEEAHELFGSQDGDEDSFSASTRTALYESMHRRIRALGARLIDVVQNPGDIPESVTSNTATVIVHRTYERKDRERIFSLLNWSNMLGQQLREFRWLGEMPVGYAIVRLHAKTNYLESAPIQIVTDPPVMGKVSDATLIRWASER